MPLDYLFGQLTVGQLLLIDLIIRDELLFRFAQQDLVAKFHRLLSLAALDQFCVLLEEAEHPLTGRHSLSRHLCPPGVVYDSLHRRQIGLQFQGYAGQGRRALSGRKSAEFPGNCHDPSGPLDERGKGGLHLPLARFRLAGHVTGNVKVQPLDLTVMEAVGAALWASSRARFNNRDATRQVSQRSDESVG